MQIVSSISRSDRSPTADSDVLPPMQKSYQNMLADDQMLDLLAKHLAKEFCVECLLSLIEMTQFANRVKEELNVEDHVHVLNIELAPNAPRSDIVYKETAPDMDTFKRMAHELYSKYVVEGSEFEINISSRMRKELVDKMDDYEDWISKENPITAKELAMVFDEAVIDNLNLLRQSGGRFWNKLSM